MFRSESSDGMLQAIATIAILAVLFWSLGLPALRLADAANLTTVSDTVSDSTPSASSTHTFVFTTPTGLVNGQTATITMPVGFTGIAALTASDVTLATTSAATIAANCSATDHIGFSTSGQNLVFEFCAGDGAYIGAGGSTTITVGIGAADDITNPATEGSYEINFTVGASDTGATRVVIINGVTVTASVDTIFTFSVSGTAAGTSMNGDTSTGNTTTTTIPFGTLTNGVATTSAQLLTVNTNAANGYSVTVLADGDLESSTGANINSFVDGSDTNDPVSWSAPTSVLGSSNTYGHWGVTTDDSSAQRGGGSNEFASQEYVGVSSTTPHIVMGHTGPANGQGVGVGTTTVGYKIQISALQEAGDDYEAVLTYVATPTF